MLKTSVKFQCLKPSNFEPQLERMEKLPKDNVNKSHSSLLFIILANRLVQYFLYIEARKQVYGQKGCFSYDRKMTMLTSLENLNISSSKSVSYSCCWLHVYFSLMFFASSVCMLQLFDQFVT